MKSATRYDLLNDKEQTLASVILFDDGRNRNVGIIVEMPPFSKYHLMLFKKDDSIDEIIKSLSKEINLDYNSYIEK